METEYNNILNKYYGYEKLKKEQYEIIDHLLNNKRDVIGILPTGFGKSIIFQLPYLITKKTVIIISPLISLMNDQETNLKIKNIPVLILNSTNNNKYSDMHTILNGEDRIIYMTPECLIKSEQFIRRLIENNRLALICFDEVHTMHEWGNAFRNAYIECKIIKDWINNIPLLALSATMTDNILTKTKSLLKLDNAIIIKTSFDRPNLYIEIKQKTKVKEDLSELLNKYKNEYIIIYCQTRKYTERLVEEINNLDIIRAYPYHAGQSTQERNDIQHKYKNGEYKCIVATIAFGMGIDIPNIRFVVHYNCPNNLEQYYQGIGRAGRDGEKSECYIFYSGKDYHISKFLLKDISDPVYKEEERIKCKEMHKYINTKKCRRKYLLGYFSEKYKHRCKNCDNCLTKCDKIEITNDTVRLLLLISEINHYGKNTLINIIRGSNAKNITPTMKNNINYGIGKDKPVDYWKNIINDMIKNKYLEEKEIDGGIYNFIKLDRKGEKLLSKIIDKHSDLLHNRDYKYE